MGAWIEILPPRRGYLSPRSLPLWERGLKFDRAAQLVRICVAPLVGAWIEIDCRTDNKTRHKVAPLVGAWIEIHSLLCTGQSPGVAPLVGAWIEIRYLGT